MTPVLPLDRARVLFDGIFTEPKLSHPEGVAIGPDGRVYAGNQDGDVLAIDPDGSGFEVVASTGGFALGLAFDGDRALFICDMRHTCVVRIDLASGRQDRWGAEGLRIPNYPVVDRARGRLIVSDSHASGTPGPGVWAFDLTTGAARLWYAGAMDFANGMAMRPGEDALYVCETFGRRVTRLPFDGEAAGPPETFAADLPGLPDGLAFDREGGLVIGCYEPSRLLRLSPDGAHCKLLIEDPTAHLLCHPTNVAFDGDRLVTANLGRWHVTEIAMDVGAPALVSA
ncbi:MAG: SMP-30/gluconolactonase/LRE family protein [Pseudomonadota bacterium]